MSAPEQETFTNSKTDVPPNWSVANRAYLTAEMSCLRRRLQLHILRLRYQWADDPLQLQSFQGVVISDAQVDQLLAEQVASAEALIDNEDPQLAEITRALEESRQQAETLRQTMIDSGRPSALDTLSDLFSLTAFDRHVLLLCLAPELDSAFERLYAYTQDDVSRKYPTPHLALALFGDEHSSENGDNTQPPIPQRKEITTVSGNDLQDTPNDEDLRAPCNRFLPEAPLRHYRLLTLEPGPVSATTAASRPLRLDERVMTYLQGVNRLDERIADLLHNVEASPLTQSQHKAVELAAQSLANRNATHQKLIVNLYGPVGAGKQSAARAMAEQLGYHLYRLELNALPPLGPERHDVLCALEREAALLRAVFYLSVDDSDTTDPVKKASLAYLFEHLDAPVYISSHERWRGTQQILPLAVTKPNSEEQHALWSEALGAQASHLQGPIETLVQQFDLSSQAITQTASAAQALARLRTPEGPGEPNQEDLWQAAREQSGWNLHALAQHISSRFTWEDIVLPDNIHKQLCEIADQVAHRFQVYERWGFGDKLARGRGISALFAGPSGTGKTMAAEVLANHLKLDLYRIDLAGVVSKYIGETEKNLKRVFDTAEQSGAILFFDEADALFGKRTEVKDSHDRYANIEIDYLLQRMEVYRGLAILATNRKSALDQAFLRRLRFLVDFPFPDAADRHRIWKQVFPQQAELDGLDYEAMARLDISGGNIKNIALNAAFLAASENQLIGMSHIMLAAQREYNKIGKLVSNSDIDPNVRQVQS